MRRRGFIILVGGVSLAWPVLARAQQPERIRRIGVLMPIAADDPESQRRMTAFVQGLQQFGWVDSGNVRIDVRWGAGDADRVRRYAAELVALAPDVVLATGSVPMRALQHASQIVPIVFVQVADPVGAGFVASLARPGGNTTGFTSFEYGISAKWLELLKQIAPRLTRVAVLRDPTNPVGLGQWGAMQAVAPSFGVELRPIDVRDAGKIESALMAFAREPNGALVVISNPSAAVHRSLIITLAVQYRLPSIYAYRYYVADGGLIAYGPDPVDQYRRAAGYIDRILKGEKPADLPVQASTKYELVINLKTANTLGLSMPPALLAVADEVIE